jgi:hypothetical protein
LDLESDPQVGEPQEDAELTLPDRHNWYMRVCLGFLALLPFAIGLLAFKSGSDVSVAAMTTAIVSLCCILLFRIGQVEGTLKVSTLAISKTGFLGHIHRIRWSEVEQVHIGSVVSVRSRRERVDINPNLFVRPVQFYNLLAERLKWLVPPPEKMKLPWIQQRPIENQRGR